MVNAASTSAPVEAPADARAAEFALALGYAPRDAMPAVRALSALDTALGAVLRTTREPLVGQMRLTWWHEALGRLDAAPPPAEPVLTALAETVLPRGVPGRALAAMTDGWEALLAEPADLALHAAARGEGLFAALATVCGAGDPASRIAAAGRGWALADLSRHIRDSGQAQAAAAMASTALKAAAGGRWSQGGRALAALAWLAQDDLAGGVPGSPRRIVRLALLRLTGR